MIQDFLKKSIFPIIAFTILLVGSANAKEIRLTILQANDVYEMTPVSGGKYGGLARVATVVKKLKKENPNTLTILSGDLLSPSAIGTAKVCGERIYGEQMVKVLNAMHWDYMTLGNHDFDIGKSAFKKRLKEACFTIFSSNVFDLETGKPFENTMTTVVFNVDGIKVGLVGIILDDFHHDFGKITDPLEAAMKAVKNLKTVENVDLLILVTHQDIKDDIMFAKELPDVDLILGGHEHENIYMLRGENFRPIAKADSNARSVYVHYITFNTNTKQVSINSRIQCITDTIIEDPCIKNVVAYWVDKAFAAFEQEGFKPNQVVATPGVRFDGLEASVRNGKTRLTELVADSALHAYPNVDLSIIQAGSIRIDDIIPPGPITQYDVIRIHPNDDSSYTKVSMPGKLLKHVLNAGLNKKGSGRFLHHANVENINNMWTINNIPIDPKKQYIVSINTYLLKGDLYKKGVTKLERTTVGTRRALIQELQQVFPSKTGFGAL